MNDNYIEFYFDCSSPWTYLGFIGIQELTERYGIELRLVPILVGGIFNSINQQVYEYRKNPMKIKDNYYSNDLLMWAKVRNIEINWPNIFPINSVKAMRGCLSFKDLNEQKTFTKKIFESYWKEGIDISDSDNLIQIVEELGFNAKKFDSFINSSGAKEQLKLNTNTLIKRGGFGSPTFFYKNMMFFGNDRIPLLESLIS